MKKLIYLIVLIVVLGLIVSGCIPVVPPTEQNETGTLPNKGPGDPGEVWNLTTNIKYNTIQLAIDAAIPGETIVVGSGTYAEVLTINTPNLTIQSTAGAASTIIDASGGASVVFINANGVTFTGFTLQNASGFNVRGINMSAGPISGCDISNITIKDLTTTGDVYGLYVIEVNSSTFSNISISAFIHTGTAGGAYGIGLNTSDGNTFTDNSISNITGWDAQGVLLNNNCDSNTFTNTVINGLTSTSTCTSTLADGYACGITIWEKDSEPSSNNNTFVATSISNLSGASSVYGIQNRASAGYEHTGNSFSDTHISGLTSTADVVLVIYNEGAKNSEFTDTYISNITAHVVAIGINNAFAFDNAVISGGEIQGLSAPVWSAGINFAFSDSTASVEGMTISGTDRGIRISFSADASQILIHCNKIEGNTEFGLLNEDTTNTVDAENNWWGAADGPSGFGSGSGDAVSSYVDFDPWLSDTLVIDDITIDPNLVEQGTVIEIKATYTGTKWITAEISWGDGSTAPGTVSTSDGIVTGSHTYAEAGVYTVTLTITDYCDKLSNYMEFQYVVVYDPSAGFVTGGGWIDSPEGAYVANPSLTGKATFGFVSKYKKGATVPTGNTEFQFKAGDLNFHSDSYDWLVITGGQKAMYKGDGTINGAGNYGFMLSAIDNDPDMFRIKIWDKDTNTDTVIYDNKVDEVDGEDGTELGGGQIVIHKGK
ncbi:hypothetical protein CVT91_10200 [Candidatus Atribacteria bacterium HGW-Atribacteria-1]|nr:MAG: hypothetical protein CVT91_10200 [Candidatus Atribacteria bacterium HGW-Atribacteria-1]